MLFLYIFTIINFVFILYIFFFFRESDSKKYFHQISQKINDFNYDIEKYLNILDVYLKKIELIHKQVRKIKANMKKNQMVQKNILSLTRDIYFKNKKVSESLYNHNEIKVESKDQSKNLKREVENMESYQSNTIIHDFLNSKILLKDKLIFEENHKDNTNIKSYYDVKNYVYKIAQYIGEGKSYKEISQHLGISLEEVKLFRLIIKNHLKLQ